MSFRLISQLFAYFRCVFMCFKSETQCLRHAATSGFICFWYENVSKLDVLTLCSIMLCCAHEMLMIYFAAIYHISKITCCCEFKTQYFRCVQIICIFLQSVCTEITIFFHFFQTIASCDHQSTSEGQLVRPFSLLFAILAFS